MTAQLSLSLEQLRLSHVTFCLTHAPDERTPIESTLEAFTEAIESGQLSHIGACNIDARQLSAAMEASARLGLSRYEWVQNEYNLLNRGDERELFAVCAEHSLGYTPYSPIAGGVLSGKYSRGKPPPAKSQLALLPGGTILNATFDAVERIRCKAALHDCSTGALALAWVMHHPSVTAAVCGPAKRAEHLQLVREALAIELNEAERAEIAAWFEAS
ncbi:aldo/keto reductase [Bradyrhizobium sp. BR 1432]|uniref:aldo/keto reductase n=1 Tax=Bradyrhizobium sp. BR 1432 TaxID=3447966 RepID=UPI003EE54E4E